MFMTLLGAFDGVYSVSPAVTIQSFSYPNKVNPNEKFSIQVVLMCHDVNGWAKVRLYLKEQELKASDGIWIGLLGKEAGSNITVVLSDIVLESSKEPYALELATFWQKLGELGETRQESKDLKITVVNIMLSADCLPKSVNANENFLLQCSVENEGNDLAYDVTAEISDYRDFSPKGGLRKEVGNLEPGQSRQVSFNLTSPFVIYGDVHRLVVTLRYQDWTNKEWAITQELSIKVDVSPVWFVSAWGPMALLVTVLFVFAVFVLFIARKAIVSRKGLEFRR
jgi:hypothetical protein